MSKISVELSDLDIIDIKEKIDLKPLIFVGTKDMIKLVKDYKNKFFIINLDNSFENGGSGGSHWVALSTFKDYPIYFDSYAVYPPLEVEKFIKQKYKKFYYWNSQIQGIRASYCGWICIMFLNVLYKDFILKNKTFFEFVNYFESLFDIDEQTKNYYVVNKYFSKII